MNTSIVSPSPTHDQTVVFLRRHDYQLVRELGVGGCGRTVLLYDDQIDEQFVCKKFHPLHDVQREYLFSNFVREIKLLHKLHHPNVVRVFNYYLYPTQFTGYILMEFINGTDVERFVADNPEKTNDLFMQAISGFAYLEQSQILHRDIRPANIMVAEDGILKIIDLGFGKHIQNSEDFDKSISLNWWCEPPEDFDDERYDFATEVYFVGKLFEKVIRENHIAHFQHANVLRKMCERNPTARLQRFADISQNIRNEQFFEIHFSQDDLTRYREFSNALCAHTVKIEKDTKYINDVARIERALNDAYMSFMLEEIVPNTALVLRCFLDGGFHFRKTGLSVVAVKQFLSLLRSCSEEQRRVVLANLHTKLDCISRYDQASELLTDECPF